MQNNQPILTKKKLILIGIGVFILLGVGAVVISRANVSQNMPENQEELYLNFAAEGSKIAGIQALVSNGGLSKTQYNKVYKVLNEKLPEAEPDSRYFIFVEESLGSKASATAESMYDNVDVSPEPGAGDETEYTREIVSDREEMEMVDTIVFTMRSESGAEYAVEVYTAGGLTRADVSIEKK